MENRATLLLALTAVIWGVGFVAQSAAMSFMGPLTFNAVRFILACAALIPVAMKFEKGGINRATIRAGLISGFIVFLASTLQQFGIYITGSAGKSAFLTGMYIILVPILGVFIGRKTTPFVWAGAILASIGIYFISAPDGLTVIDVGTVLLTLCAVVWAVDILVIDDFVNEETNQNIKPLSLSVVRCFICGTLSLFAALIFEDAQPANILNGYIPILYSAFISVSLAHTLQIVGQKHVPPGRSAVIFSMESVMGAIAETIILGIFLTFTGYIGGGLIFSGIIISQINSFFPKKAHE
ncbi:MAG: DMT family transporter [Turicibacter sp.]|nr:DMT family transporter [Turicibacter sp.]